MKPEEWKKLFELRDDLLDEDRAVLRKLIKYVEWLEKERKTISKLVNRNHPGDEKP